MATVNLSLNSEQAHYLLIQVRSDVEELQECIEYHMDDHLGQMFRDMLPIKVATLALIEEAIKNRSI